MQQFYASVSFCYKNAGYLFILCLPVMTVEFTLVYFVMSLGIEPNMSETEVEVISSVAIPIFILLVLSLILSVSILGGAMISFKALSANNAMTPYQDLYLGTKKFFPLLLGYLIHSLAFSVGMLFLVFPGFFLYARLGLFPLYIMFEDNSAMDALNKSWHATDEVAMKLFALTAVFIGIQLIFSLIGGLTGIDSSIGFLAIATLIKYATMMPLLYLFFSLYQSITLKQ
ncbi:hypothetical protein OAC45_00045 [Gammaproteobacteria bacterium]|jgi:hypothetical protein|nr:hypothetical protein [Gammaproteobacteria bacterium]|tara:strand:- start:835 stop:1518 length:684 start_codon:yes stop_codon:yes gene_type:complete